VLGAVSAAAEDITVALLDAPGAPAVTVRLDGDEVRVEARLTEAPEPAGAPPADRPIDGAEDENTARVSLRLSETLKKQIDAAARRDGVSVNTWLLRAATHTLADTTTPRSPHAPGPGSAQRLTGWING
jgi:hypothetical protein